MNRWRIIAIIGYIIPLVFAIFTGLFTKFGNDIENCIFVFFIGIAVQCIIGIYGFIKLINEEQMKKERMLFLISIFPFIIILLLFFLSGGYA